VVGRSVFGEEGHLPLSVARAPAIDIGFDQFSDGEAVTGKAERRWQPLGLTENTRPGANGNGIGEVQ
jgi:hypothetical protein